LNMGPNYHTRHLKYCTIKRADCAYVCYWPCLTDKPCAMCMGFIFYLRNSPMELFALKDTATDRWYIRNSWGKKPRVLRERGPMKQALLFICERDGISQDTGAIPHPATNCHADWRKFLALRNKELMKLLPATYEIWICTGSDMARVGTVADWY
jgi:hypothetical protein